MSDSGLTSTMSFGRHPRSRNPESRKECDFSRNRSTTRGQSPPKRRRHKTQIATWFCLSFFFFWFQQCATCCMTMCEVTEMKLQFYYANGMHDIER